MRNTTLLPVFIAILFMWIFFSSCQQPQGNQTGSEFMPDMAHSVAYEANTYNYYFLNTWGGKEEYYDFASPRLPVEGTVARGYAGMQLDPANADKITKSLSGQLSSSSISVPVNGNVPYPYPDTEEGRAAATSELIQAPYPITKEGLDSGKELYNIYCGICHGEKGDGLGYLVREDGGKYPAQPANLLLEQYVAATNGQMYHALVYGKNLMGGYSDKLSFKERWDVIHYVRSLQAKELKLAYSASENTLNDWATPASDIRPIMGDALDRGELEDELSEIVDEMDDETSVDLKKDMEGGHDDQSKGH